MAHMMHLAPIASDIFSQIASPGYQKQFMTCLFDYMSEKHKLAGTGYGPGGGPGFYRNRKNFTQLVPEVYAKSQNAPRITSLTSNALHGMRKDFQVLCLKTFTILFPQYFFLEVDLSACHTRIASSLLAKEGNPLELSLAGDNFWKTEVGAYLPWFQDANPSVVFKNVKDILKVFLYTSLNGGNPGSPGSLDRVLKGKASHLIQEPFKNQMYEVTAKVAKDWPLTTAVQGLNKTCFCLSEVDPDRVYVYCLDQIPPYILSKSDSYCGISRVLQSFEIVLLSVLTGFLAQRSLLAISLEHDGCWVIGSREDANEPVGPLLPLMKEYEVLLSGDMQAWSQYLVTKPVTVTIKRMICDGQVQDEV